MQGNALEISIANHPFSLHADRALYWPEHKWLILSDVHLGKSAHFRQSGIALPNYNVQVDLDRIQNLIEHYNPKTVIFTGDLFHSHANKEWEEFRDFRQQFQCDFALIEGNHDLITTQHLEYAQVEHWGERIQKGNFTLQHHPAEIEGTHVLCGHIHPGVIVAGKGRQKLKLPALISTKNCTYLPAFGSLTGSIEVKNIRPEQTFAFSNNQVFEIK